MKRNFRHWDLSAFRAALKVQRSGYIWIIVILFLSFGCHSVRSGAALKEKQCPEMTFVIDSLQTNSGVIYFTKITYSNLSEEPISFYHKSRISLIELNSSFSAWFVYLRSHNDLNSIVIMESGMAMVDSLVIPTETFLEIRGREIVLGRSGDQQVERRLIKKRIYLSEEICPMISTNSIFIP